MSIESYLNPGSAPAERPRLQDMHSQTADLHRAIDATIRARGVGYLNPAGETLQVDLLGSPNMVTWQEGKAELTFGGRPAGQTCLRYTPVMGPNPRAACWPRSAAGRTPRARCSPTAVCRLVPCCSTS